MTKLSSTFGEIFCRLREEKNVSQMEIAKFLGYKSSQMVSNVECGVAYFPRDILYKVCAKYKMNYKLLAARIVAEKFEKLTMEWVNYNGKMDRSKNNKSDIYPRRKKTPSKRGRRKRNPEDYL